MNLRFASIVVRRDSRGLLFYRLIQQAATTDPILYTAGMTLGKLQQIDYGWAEVRIYDREASMICEGPAPAPPAYQADIEPENVVAEDKVTLVYEMAD